MNERVIVWKPKSNETISGPEALALVPSEYLRTLSVRNGVYSTLKTVIYFSLIAILSVIYLTVPGVWTGIFTVLGMGVVFAHGLELQHEALHGNLFGNARLNRIVGFLFGLPMLVSFTHYRSYHFHHHQAVGTDRDEELVNYSIASLRSWPALMARAWNIGRIPKFVVTLGNMLRGRWPDKVKMADRERLLGEYCMQGGLVLFGLAASLYFQSEALVVLWLLPWLLVAEPMHFIIELPEHLGCKQGSPSILRNTRSYRAGWFWGYLTNHNNMHIEHHMYPTIPAHRLKRIHPVIRNAGGHCSNTYWAALNEVVRAARQADVG